MARRWVCIREPGVCSHMLERRILDPSYTLGVVHGSGLALTLALSRQGEGIGSPASLGVHAHVGRRIGPSVAGNGSGHWARAAPAPISRQGVVKTGSLRVLGGLE